MSDWDEWAACGLGDASAEEDNLRLTSREFIREPFATVWRDRKRTIHGVVLVRLVGYFEREVDATYEVTGRFMDGLYRAITDHWKEVGAAALAPHTASDYLASAVDGLCFEDMAELAAIFGCDRTEYTTTIFTSDADAWAVFNKAMLPRVKRLLKKLERGVRAATRRSSGAARQAS